MEPITTSALNIASRGDLNKVVGEKSYDNVFGTKIRFDKNHRVAVQVNPGPVRSDAVSKSVQLPQETTLQQFFEKGEELGNQIGHFYRYSGYDDNCQKFIRTLLNASGVSSLDSFISQDTGALIKSSVLRTITRGVTDATALVDYAIKGGKKKSKVKV